MKTALIILQYNNFSDTINCIKSVETFNSADICYIIVDNNSSDVDSVRGLIDYLRIEISENFQILEAAEDNNCPLPRYTFLLNKENRGYAAGNNIGLQIALSDPHVDSILILNNDILFVEDIIPQMRNFLFQTENCAIVSPVLFRRDGIIPDWSCARRNVKPSDLILLNIFSCSRNISQKYIDKQYVIKDEIIKDGSPVKIELPSGSCMLIAKSFFQETGYFDEDTFLYYEENILFKKVQRQGKSNYLLPCLKCIHLGGESTRSINSVKLLKISRDSCMYYLRKYCSYSKITVWVVALTWNIRIAFLSAYKSIVALFS